MKRTRLIENLRNEAQNPIVEAVIPSSHHQRRRDRLSDTAILVNGERIWLSVMKICNTEKEAIYYTNIKNNEVKYRRYIYRKIKNGPSKGKFGIYSISPQNTTPDMITRAMTYPRQFLKNIKLEKMQTSPFRTKVIDDED